MQSQFNRLAPDQPKAFPRANEDPGALAALELQLKREVLRETDPLLSLGRVEHALREAAAQASSTAFPTLWFPELAREKIQEARAWAHRQQQIRIRSFVSFSA